MIDYKERLDHIFNLEPGWLDGEGEAIDNRNREYLTTKIVDTVKDKKVGIFPTLSGDIQLELTIQDYSVEIIINPVTLMTNYNALNLVNGWEVDVVLNLSLEDDWAVLEELLVEIP